MGEIDAAGYTEHVDGLARFLDGDTDEITARLRAQMQAASDVQEYEQGARLRDQLAAVERAMERQELVSQRTDDFDLIAFQEDELEVVLVVLTVKRGRVTGRKVSVVDKVADVSSAELVGILLGQLLRIGTTASPSAGSATARRGRSAPRMAPATARFRRVVARAKERVEEAADGDGGSQCGSGVCATSTETAHRPQCPRQGTAQPPGAPRSSEPPLRIECYDISTIQGRDTVGSMVVFEDALPRKSDYRRFKVRTVVGQDDFAAMEEGLAPPLPCLPGQQGQTGGRSRKVRIPTVLVVIDGGLGQLGRAVAVLDELELDIPVRRARQEAGAGIQAGIEHAHRHTPWRGGVVPTSAGARTRPTGSRSHTTAICAANGWSTRFWMPSQVSVRRERSSCCESTVRSRSFGWPMSTT